jgi:ribose 5-phosphate isomerase A
MQVLPFTHKPILQKLAALGGKPALRSGSGKAGPVVTDNGNFIVDVEFGPMTTERAAELHGQIKALTGVVETGLFVGMASKAYIGEKDGSVRTLIPQL